MNFIRRHWYDVGLGVALIVLTWQSFAHIEGLQLILLLNLVVLFVHQYEEYHWPGGEPWILNEVLQRASGGPADRYPLNQNNAAFINIMAWLFYLLPALLPGAIWLGLGQILFGLIGQVIVHGIVTNVRLKTWYNPGLTAVLLGHVPLGIWYLAEVTGQGLVQRWDWLFALLYLGTFIGVVMRRVGYGLLVSTTSPYPFTPKEMGRFDRERRLRHAGITPYPLKREGGPTGAE